DQRAVTAQATQADFGQGLRRGTGLRTERAEAVEGGVAQEVGNRDLAGQLEVDAVDDGDRQRTFDVGALDARTRHLDAVQGGGLVVLRVRGGGDQAHQAQGACCDAVANGLAQQIAFDCHYSLSNVRVVLHTVRNKFA